MNFLQTILIALWPEPKAKRGNKELANTGLSYIGRSSGLTEYGFDSDRVWLHAETNQWIRKFADDFYVEIKRNRYNEYKISLYYQNCEAETIDVFKTIDDAKRWVDDNAISFKNSIKSVRADMQTKNKKSEEFVLRNNGSKQTSNYNSSRSSSNDWPYFLRIITIIVVLLLFLASGSWNWISLFFISIFIIFVIIITK